MLCSFLVPSRFRFARLLKLIESIYAASETEDFEIVVRLHEDDAGSIGRVTELNEMPRVRYIIGKTLDGYKSLHLFTAELIDAAKGEWCWLFNDDMVLAGTGWEKQLREMDRTALVQPEFHWLNQSCYPRDEGGPAPCHANRPEVAELLRRSGVPAVDVTLRWAWKFGDQRPIRFLAGMAVHHQWGGIESHAA
jgi:hypothetical protein